MRALEQYAFRGCGALAEVAIPDSVTSIRQGAFVGVPLPPAQADTVARINPQATRAGGASAVVE